MEALSDDDEEADTFESDQHSSDDEFHDTLFDLVRSYDISQEGIWSEFPPQLDMYVGFTVVVDIDRQLLTVNGDMHYDLFDIPEEWRECPDDPQVIEDSRTKVSYRPSEPDEDLVEFYNAAHVEVIPTESVPRPTPNFPRVIMTDMIRNYLETFRFPFQEFQHEWGPSDIQFQRLVYALVKLASWAQFGFRLLDEEEIAELDEEYKWGDFLRDCHVPSSETYCVPGGLGQVLIHLQSHLDEDFREGLGRVIKFLKETGQTSITACIISLVHVVVVEATLEKGTVFVKHTTPTRLDSEFGPSLLIGALYPAQSANTVDFYTIAANLPAEIIANIFHELCITPDGVDTIPSWRLACKAFNDIADRHVFSLPDLTIFDFAEFEDHRQYRAADINGTVNIWTRDSLYWGGRREYRWYAVPLGETIWSSLGCGVFRLSEVNEKVRNK